MHRDQYWGYVIGVDSCDGTSVLSFKKHSDFSFLSLSSDDQGLPSHSKYNIFSDGISIPGTYERLFQYTMMNIMKDIHKSVVFNNKLHVLQNSRQLVMTLTLDVLLNVYSPKVLNIRSFDDLEQCSLLAVNSLHRRMEIPVGDFDLDEVINDTILDLLDTEIFHGINNNEEMKCQMDNNLTPAEMESISDLLAFGVHHLSTAVQHALLHIISCHQSYSRLQKLQKCVKGMPKMPLPQDTS